MFLEIADRDQRRAPTRRRADSQCPTWAKSIGHPTDERRAEWCGSQRNGEKDRYHTTAHGRVGRELYEAVGGSGEGLCGNADDDEREAKETVARHDRGQRAAESECCRADEQ